MERWRPTPTLPAPETAPSTTASPPPASRAAPWPESTLPARDAPRTLQPAESPPLAGHAADVTSIAISPDGRWLASAGNDKKLMLWDAAKGVSVRQWTAHGFRITSLAFSPDGRQVLSASDERRGNLRLWDTASGRLVHSFDGQNFGLEAAAFSPDGKLVAACGGPRGNVTLWDAKTGRAVRTLSADAYALAFSPDGRTLATAGAGRAISLWEVSSGQALHRLEGHTDAVRSLSFSRDGQLLASAGDDSRIRVWRVAEHRQVQALPLPWAVAVAFFPDGRRLLAGARIWGGNMPRGPQIWDLATHAPLATLNMGSPTRAIAVASDGSWVASSDKQSIRVWKMPS